MASELTPEDLARAVALPGWRWMAGMRADDLTHKGYFENRCAWMRNESPDPEDDNWEDEHGARVQYMGIDYIDENGHSFPSWGWPANGSGWLPDYTDPATAGCLLELLGDEHAPSLEWTYIADLGAACIRAALALGRWPGGER